MNGAFNPKLARKSPSPRLGFMGTTQKTVHLFVLYFFACFNLLQSTPQYTVYILTSYLLNHVQMKTKMHFLNWFDRFVWSMMHVGTVFFSARRFAVSDMKTQESRMEHTIANGTRPVKIDSTCP